MADFKIVDLTLDAAEPQGSSSGSTAPGAGSAQGGMAVGHVDTAAIAASLEDLRQDLAAHVKTDEHGLRLKKLSVKLTVSAEGKVAFIAKGAAAASIEVTFEAGE